MATTAAPDTTRAAEALRRRLPRAPGVTLVLGSGLGHLAERIDDPVEVPFGELPGLPAATVSGHAGTFMFGSLAGVDVLLQRGRYHAYEGHPMEVVVAPVRICAALGVHSLVVTNAAGAVDRRIGPGDVVLIDDHLNLMFRSPLAGPVAAGEERFPDMSAPYDGGLQAAALAAAARLGVPLARGTYAAVLGPAYETAAEVRMLDRLGADLVGMSTVPEVTAARAAGMRCLGFSMVTNRAAGTGGGPLSHDEVLEVGREAGARLGDVIVATLPELGAQSTGAK